MDVPVAIMFSHGLQASWSQIVLGCDVGICPFKLTLGMEYLKKCTSDLRSWQDECGLGVGHQRLIPSHSHQSRFELIQTEQFLLLSYNSLVL